MPVPYKDISEIPEYVPKKHRKKWMSIFNAVYNNADKKKSKEEAKKIAYAVANAWLKKRKAKVDKKLNEMRQERNRRVEQEKSFMGKVDQGATPGMSKLTKSGRE